MTLYLSSIQTKAGKGTDEVILCHPCGMSVSVPCFPFAELGKEKTDDVISSIHVDQRRETDEGMSIKKR
jgi:hypothetical protein